MKTRTICSCALAYIAISGAASQAFAQAQTSLNFSPLQDFTQLQDFITTDSYDRGRNIGVLDRDRPQYDAVGVHVGGFTVFPKLQTDLGASDNVFATHSDKTADGFVQESPSARLVSNWSRNSLTAEAGASFSQFFTQSTENENGGYGKVDGRLDVYQDSYLAAGLDAQRIFEPRTDTGSPADAVEPVPIDTEGGYLQGLYQTGRFRLRGDLQARNYDYENVDSLLGGVIEQSDRDRVTVDERARSEFAVTPDTAVFLQYTHENSDYTRSLVGEPTRDSEENRFLVGADFDISALVRGALGIGYADRQYETPLFPNISGVILGAKVEYFATPVATVTLAGSRVVEDSAFVNSGGFFNNSVALKLDYEVLRNLLVTGAVGFEEDDYQGLDRTDRIPNAILSARYFVDRNWGIAVTGNYGRRESSGTFSSPSFDVSSVFVSLIFQR